MGIINEYKPYEPKKVIDGVPDYTIRKDTLYRSTPVEVYEDGVTICKEEEVIAKEAFIKCYEEWILNKHTDDGKQTGGSGLMSSLYSDALEKEYPQECQEIRADEREKTINEMLEKIREMIIGHTVRKGGVNK